MASEAVRDFLEEHNRPFSASEIQKGAKGDFGKSAVQKALESLVAKRKVKEKVYGKQKVYCIVQKTDCSAADLRESLLEVDRKINETTQQLKEVTEKLKSVTAAEAQLKGGTTMEEAVDRKMNLEKELEEVKKHLERYVSAGDGDVVEIHPDKKLQVQNEYDRLLSEYKKRKRMCMDAVNSILENYPKSKKSLFEDIGLETDEDAGFSLEKV